MTRRRPEAPPAPASPAAAPAVTGPANGHVARRGELMAEVFLEIMEPAFLARGDVLPVTFLAGLPNGDGGVNTWSVDVLATADPVGEAGAVTLPAGRFDRLANSSPPTLLLVADALRDELFYAWPAEVDAARRGGTCEVPVRPAKADRDALLARFTAPPAHAFAAIGGTSPAEVVRAAA